ncbi:MAG TPA: BrnT family toxin [Methylococcus sp.]|nr:BrnT family toxin [Methylococcus sp.]
MVVRFTWDEVKNRINQRKHGVSFETAKLVFDDPLHLTRLERIENGEERWQTLGLAGGVVLLLVAHTVTELDADDTLIRILSARKADRTERRIYEQGT